MTDMLACIALLVLARYFYEHRPCAILLCIFYDLLRIVLIPLDRARLLYDFTPLLVFITCMAYFGFLTVFRVALCGFGSLNDRVNRGRTARGEGRGSIS